MADLDPLVTQALKKIRSGQEEHRTRVKRFNTSYDIYRASEPNAKGTSSWQSKVRVPYAMQVIDTGLVNIVSGQPRIKVTPRTPEDEGGAKAMQVLMDYFIAEDHFTEKQTPFTQQGLIYGLTVAKNHWLYQESLKTSREFTENPFDRSQPGIKISKAQSIIRDGPTFEPWDVYRAYWSPGARDADDADYVVLQTYISKNDLQRNALNPDTGTGLYRNVDKLLASGSPSQPDQTAQARYLGLPDNRTKDLFLVEEIWTDNTLVVIGNGQILLRAEENPYWHGKKPIVIADTRPDLFEIQGIPETELVDHLQQALWTLQNATIDNLHLTVMRGITYREGGVTDPNALELRPRFKWPVSDHDDIRPFEVQPVSSDVYNERQRLLADMQLVTGINPYVSGSDLNTVDQNTATGVTALQEVASRLLRFKAAQIHYKGYQRSFEMWGDMIQQYLDHDIAVKIYGAANDAQWVEVSPQDVAGHYHYTLEGSEESLSRQQERGEAIALLNAFAPLIPTGQVNIKPLLEKVAVAYGFPNAQALLVQPPQQQQPAAPTQNQAQQQAPASAPPQVPMEPQQNW